MSCMYHKIIALILCGLPILMSPLWAHIDDQIGKEKKAKDSDFPEKTLKKNKVSPTKKAIEIKPSLDDETIKSIRSIVIQKISSKEKIKKLDTTIKTAIQNNLPNSLALSYYEIGQAYKELGQWQVALQFLQLSNKKNTTIVPANIHFDIGVLLSKTGEFKASNVELMFYRNGKSLSQAEQLKTDYAIAENYFAMEQFRKAIVLYETIVQIEKRKKNQVDLLECYSRLAACYISIGETKKGVDYYTASLKKVDKNKAANSEKIKETKEVVSKALRKKGKFKEDLALRNSALAYDNSISNDGLEYLRLAQSYLKIKQIQKAESSIDSYLSNPSYNLIDKSEIEVLKELSGYIKKKGNSDKAYRYLSLYTSLEDTIKNRLLKLDQKNNGIEGYKNILQLEILQKDKEISINALNHLIQEDELKENALTNHRLAIGLLLFVLVIGIIGGIYILRVSKQRRIANQQLALRSLRSQMNPHFIFNALNSVNSFISENDERSANRFLSEFSRLMRLVMENSEYDFISLSKELEILRIYLQLEHFRFKDKFNYTIDVDENIDEESFYLPPMLIQPYIENAIWHGLRYKETKGDLSLTFKLSTQKLLITIQDNGIGRKKSAEIKTNNQKKNKSTALKNINERIVIFNDLHKIKIDVTITDVESDGSGTCVSLSIPQTK